MEGSTAVVLFSLAETFFCEEMETLFLLIMELVLLKTLLRTGFNLQVEVVEAGANFEKEATAVYFF